MKNKKQPLVCIVIVNWNGGEKIKNCLTSLKITTYSNYKVIIVDNGSKKESIDELKKINKNMSILRLPENYGYTIAENVGWKYALKNLNADYVCAMDSDIVTIQPNWLSLEIEYLEKSKERGISCGKLVFPDNRLQLLYMDRHPTAYEEIDNGQYDFIKEVSAVGGACIIIKKEVIKKIGYYDENFFYGPNDIDYCLRARKFGFKIIYNGLAKSIHIGSSSYLASDRTKIFGAQSEGNILFTIRHSGKIMGLKMILMQLVRVFITRKDPYLTSNKNNVFFHKDIFKRLSIYFNSVSNALNNYNVIKKSNHKKIIIDK